MSNNNEEEAEGFFSKMCKLICGTVSGFGTKLKLIITGIISVAGMLLFFFAKKKLNEKEILRLELQKVRKELQIAKNEAVIDSNNAIIEGLEAREVQIRTEIESILTKERGGDLTPEELDEFFDSRGF